MKLTKISKIEKGQDGAIFGEFLFRFNSRGQCNAYNMKDIMNGALSPVPIASFKLDRCDELCPHSNAVVFGNEYFAEGDEFPLLYTNVYNSCCHQENKRKGLCCVYRLLHKEKVFRTELVQLIEIGFTEDSSLWASEGLADVRPYGNFVIDREHGKYYAFTMIDNPHITRYFAFDLPKLSHGSYDSEFNVKKVVLAKDDIRESFELVYHNFIQGAVLRDGFLYSLEGFGTDSGKNPILRVIDVNKKCEVDRLAFADAGADTEPELIDFYGDKCIYSDAHGDVYLIESD